MEVRSEIVCVGVEVNGPGKWCSRPKEMDRHSKSQVSPLSLVCH